MRLHRRLSDLLSCEPSTLFTIRMDVANWGGLDVPPVHTGALRNYNGNASPIEDVFSDIWR